MTITYKRPFGDRTTRQVILHRVCYGEPAKEIYGPQSGFKLYPLHDVAIIEWCEQNCKADWHRSPKYVDQTYIEFEDDEDAMMFSLVWL